MVRLNAARASNPRLTAVLSGDATLQMHQLRCKRPELVRKESWTHFWACNLIRTVMAQAAATHDLLPRCISFKGTIQTLEPFSP